MTKRSKKSEARIVQVLLWYDYPEIVLLQKSSVEYIIAVSAVSCSEQDSDATSDISYVGAAITKKQLTEYQNQKFDLRYLISHAALRRYWTFRFSGAEQEVKLERVTRNSEVLSRSLPESGFFSRSHEKIDLVQQITPNALETFNIDGSWELGEFSKFYGQFEDVYYICRDLDRYNDGSTSPKTRDDISKAFNRPWRGGGSYVSFYDKIANDNQYENKLLVSGIQYNSPGYVKVKARQDSFDAVITLLQTYAENPDQTRKSYNTLYKYLSEHSLLKAAPDVKIRTHIQENFERFAIQLSGHLPNVDFGDLRKMADNNSLIAAKVLLSIYRRMTKLFDFFDEGRVKYHAIDIDPLRDTES